MEIIHTEQAPAAIGPYSQGVHHGRHCVYLGADSGRPEDRSRAGGIAAQAEQSCKNVAALLEAAGTKLENVFKTTCFLRDMADFAAFNAVYAKYFVSKPARSCVAVRELPKGVLCEIEAIAAK